MRTITLAAAMLLLACGDLHAQPANPADNAPAEQVAFLLAIQHGRESYAAGANDMARGAARPQRARDLCAALPGGAAKDWIGTVTTLSSTGSGRGVMAIEVGPKVTFGTANTDFFDGYGAGPTTIPPGSVLFEVASRLQVGSQVRFSASILPGKDDCFKEMSLSMRGALTEPDFQVRFVAISTDLDRPKPYEPPALPTPNAAASPPPLPRAPTAVTGPRMLQPGALDGLSSDDPNDTRQLDAIRRLLADPGTLAVINSIKEDGYAFGLARRCGRLTNQEGARLTSRLAYAAEGMSGNGGIMATGFFRSGQKEAEAAHDAEPNAACAWLTDANMARLRAVMDGTEPAFDKPAVQARATLPAVPPPAVDPTPSTAEARIRALGAALTLSRNCGTVDRPGAKRVAAAVDADIKSMDAARRAAVQQAWIDGLRAPESRLNGDPAEACARLTPDMAATLRFLSARPSINPSVEAGIDGANDRLRRMGTSLTLGRVCGVVDRPGAEVVAAAADVAIKGLPASAQPAAQAAWIEGLRTPDARVVNGNKFEVCNRLRPESSIALQDLIAGRVRVNLGGD